MTLRMLVEMFLSSIGQPFVSPDRAGNRPANEEWISLMGAANQALGDIYLVVVGVPWENLPGESLAQKVGFPDKLVLYKNQADADKCASAFERLMADELRKRNMTWPLMKAWGLVSSEDLRP